MGHYKMLDRMPSAMITSGHNELKVYQGNIVYLNDGDNFELRFFNPLKEKIGVEINFNGIKKGDGYLVLNPGQDITLDRFLDEQRKMLFETYTVDGNNKAAMEAIEENGLITFNFYKERHSYTSDNFEVDVKHDFPPKKEKRSRVRGSGTNNYNSNSRIYSNFNGGGLPHFSNINKQKWSPIVENRGSLSGSSGGAGTHGTSGFSSNTYANLYNVNGMGATSEYIASNTSTTVEYGDYLAEATMDFMSQELTREVETGRIERGDESRQDLRTIDLQFKPDSFHSVSFKLMPSSSMNKTVAEIREYCECGYRIRKKSWKFCPKCGRRL